MKHLRTFFSVSLILTLTVSALTGCKSRPQDVNCPLTEMTWENSVEDVIAAEGDDYTTYESVYNGTTYVFPKDYLGMNGTLKYMFDDNDELMCVAWTYSSDTEDDLQDTYSQIHKQLEDTYGESGYDTKQQTNYGDVWHLEGGDIIISAVTTGTQKALQYSYLNPKVSNTKTEEN